MGTQKEKVLYWGLLIFGIIILYVALNISSGELGIGGWISLAVLVFMLIIYPIFLLKGAYSGSKK